MIDKKQADTISASILKDVLEPISGRYTRSFALDNFVRDFDSGRHQILGEALSKLWDQLMSACNAYGPGAPLLVSEKALACLLRRGVDRNDLRMNGTSARVTLTHLTYFVDKEGASCSAGPCVPSHLGHLPMRWIALSGEDFADFIFEFDDIVGDIIRQVDEVLLRYKAKAMQFEIICKTVDELGEQFLKPHGICWSACTDFTDSTVPVRFSDGIHPPIREVLPIDSLSEAFQSIPGKMAAQEELEFERNRRSFPDFDLVFQDTLYI